MNTEPTIYLEANYSDHQIKIGIQRSQDMVWHYDTLPVTISELDECVTRLTENINQMNRTQGQTRIASEKIMSLGQRLCDALLSKEIKDLLRASTAEYLILKLDDTLVSIPWELICIDNRLLCERFCMGRVVKTHQSVSYAESRKLTPPLTMWILSGDNDSDLSGVDQETDSLLCRLDQLNQDQVMVNAAFDQGGTVDQVQSQLRNFDMVHFAGHGDYDSEKPEASGWRFSDAHLTAKDIDRMSGSAAMPSLIFSNACQSARTCQWSLQGARTDGSFDLANAFMRSGVRHYLGTFWEIPDQAGSNFAQTFYQSLFHGNTIGMALKLARKTCMETDGSPIGAAYVLYGDPTQTYISGSTDNQTVQTRSSGFRPFRAISEKIQSLPLNGLWLCLCMAIVIVGLWIGYQALLRVDRYQDMDMQKIVKDRAHKKRDYIDQLFSEIEKLTGQSPQPHFEKPDDSWTSRQLTLSIDYETYFSQMDRSQASLIAAVLGKSLIENHHVTVLERVYLDKILEELKRANSGLIDTNNRIRPDLLPSRLIIFMELHVEQGQTTVLMHLADIEQGHVVDYFFLPLLNRSILKQQKHLSRPLIEALRKYYPIRGRIQHIQDQRVNLNIGHVMGVRKNQVFVVLKNNLHLTVQTCLPHTCTARINDPRIKLERGLKVEIRNYQ